MATAVSAARYFVSGPHVVEAARQLLNQFSVTAICEALTSARGDDADSLIDALERLVEFEEVRTTFLSPESVIFLQRGAAAPDPRIRSLVAKLLAQLANTEASAVQLIDADLLSVCHALLLVEETDTAEASARVLRGLIKWPAGQKAILGNGVDDGGLTQRLQQQLPSIPDTQRIRVLHLFIELGKESGEVFAAIQTRGAYKNVLDAFLTDDILLKLNAVELMDNLGSFKAGQEFLSREGLPERLARELGDPMCDDSVRLCVVGLLGHVILRSPESLSVLLPTKDSPFAQSLSVLLESRDPTGRLCALTAWANISVSGLAGLGFFLKWSQVMEKVISSVGASQNEVCKCAMGGWAEVLQKYDPPGSDAMDVTDGVAADAEVWTIAEKDILPVVVKNLAGKPFPDTRVQTWALLAALVRTRSAAQKILPAQEMRDLMLDFASEQNSDARIAKHEFVISLQTHNSEWVGAFLDEESDKILTEYARQGPHWVPRGAQAIVGDQAS